MQNPNETLARLGLADSEIKAYLAMLGGARKVAEIMKTTRQKRPTVYYALAKLAERGLLRKTGRADEPYTPEPAERLRAIGETRMKEAQDLTSEIEALIPSLGQEGGRLEKPQVAFYEGVEAAQNVVMETLYCRSRHIDSIAPTGNFFWSVGPGFAAAYVAERARRRIKTRNLWEAPIDPKRMRPQDYRDLSEIRILPKVMHGRFATTVFLFDDKTLYISSLKNAYALLVTSQEHHDAMTAVFDGLWQASKTT